MFEPDLEEVFKFPPLYLPFSTELDPFRIPDVATAEETGASDVEDSATYFLPPFLSARDDAVPCYACYDASYFIVIELSNNSSI